MAINGLKGSVFIDEFASLDKQHKDCCKEIRRLKRIRLLGVILTTLSVILLFKSLIEIAHAAVPQQANAHKRTLIRTAHSHWGLDAPVSLFAAQIHQESGWRIDARSPAGAEGLAQFMPATSEWFALRNPRDLTTAQPYNPAWAMRALVLYNQHLFKQIQASSPCQQWAFTLSSYNGGLVWVNRDKALASASGADSLAWFDSTELYNAGRSKAAFAENRHYPKAIIYRHQPLYVAAGWGAGVCHAF